MGPLNKVVQGIGRGIGMAQEYRANNESSKSASAQEPHSGSERDSTHISSRGKFDDPPPDYESDPDEEYDAEDWELDEAQRQLAPTESGPKFEELTGDDGVDVDKILQAYFQKYPTNPNRSELQPLPCPVILPQRRPQTNTRGFVHAYAPVLQNSGVDQAQWMDFLTGFHKAIKMSPYFHAVNGCIAVGALGLQIAAGPSIVIHAAALAIHISVEASRRGYTRYSTNKYLDTMNEQVFKPRGLYCMIMTYKPDSDNAAEMIDMSSQTTRAVAKRVRGDGHKFSSSSGKTHGDFQMPEAAPLVFPELDKLPPDTNVLKKGGAFLADYFDRKAQADFERNNPQSKLNVAPKPEFKSKFLDPNHPMNDGSLIALATGGKIAGKKTRRARRRGQVDPATGQPKPREKKGPISMVKRSLKENVLYLMVVNLPSDEELAEATEDLKKAHLFDFQ